LKPPSPESRLIPEIQSLYEHDLREMWDPKIAPHIWNQYHHQLGLYRQLVRNLRPNSILDVGCAQGTLALLLAEAGYKVVANDIRVDFLEYAKSRYEHGDIEFVAGNVFEVQLTQRFDLVFANQIIEHLVYPTEFLRQLSDLLNPGGHVIVTTPNHSYFKNSLPTYAGIGDPALHVDRQFTADADGHFFAYTAEELTEFAKAAGFRRVSPFFFETPWISGHVKVRYLHSFTPVAVLRSLDYLTRIIPAVERRACHQLGVIAQLTTE
jgi:2-polyprenyl-3-methyl-5-hydroxy-6-metoxy-1,4-benzoquinol methylase